MSSPASAWLMKVKAKLHDWISPDLKLFVEQKHMILPSPRDVSLHNTTKTCEPRSELPENFSRAEMEMSDLFNRIHFFSLSSSAEVCSLRMFLKVAESFTSSTFTQKHFEDSFTRPKRSNKPAGQRIGLLSRLEWRKDHGSSHKGVLSEGTVGPKLGEKDWLLLGVSIALEEIAVLCQLSRRCLIRRGNSCPSVTETLAIQATSNMFEQHFRNERLYTSSWVLNGLVELNRLQQSYFVLSG